ncbi:MAG: hypothetical protein OEW87_02210 [Flavobacteriaceae bacterium]|nr:hypothetical protein [Flavobacteriaceae bacterium]
MNFISKSQIKLRFVLLASISVFLLSTLVQSLYAQDTEKNSVRLKANYFKIMDSEVYFNIAASSRIDRQNVDVANIDIIITNEIEDEEIELGKVTTNMKGEAKFVLKSLSAMRPDSTGLYTISMSFKGNDAFKRASKSISFRDATIKANLITKDSVNYISATLLDTAKDSILSDQLLNVQVQRLFRNLRIGKEFNSTDENGTILVPIEEGIPGVDGNLTLEVVLNDSDDYGTVKALVKAPLGTPIVDESTFDQRKMWSPRNKTPLFLLIFPNLIIFGMWAFIIYLFINLFRIAKT